MSTTILPSLPAAQPAEAQSVADRRLVEAFLADVSENVYFKDRESRFLAVSRSYSTWAHIPCAALIGKTDADVFTGVHARQAFEDEQRIIRTGEPLLGKVEKETWPDGRVTWVQTSKLPLRDAGGGIVGTFGISKDVTELVQTQAALDAANKQLLIASRRAGMAEVATGVLHNIGNVLNSLNVSAIVIQSGLRQSKVESLARLAELLREHTADMADYIGSDPKGRQMPGFLGSLVAHFVAERTRLLGELASLQKDIAHVRDIISIQQSLATVVGIVEVLDPTSLMEDAVRMNSAALVRHDVTLRRHYQFMPAVRTERPKVLQILVNLIRNAKYALDDGGPPEKIMTLSIEPGAPGFARLLVEDNGVGIPAENLARVFHHGFTTRKQGGHGFGLHSAINAARELQGTLTVTSAGPGRGAVFALELPLANAVAHSQ